jgi:hypothetical protein
MPSYKNQTSRTGDEQRHAAVADLDRRTSPPASRASIPKNAVAAQREKEKTLELKWDLSPLHKWERPLPPPPRVGHSEPKSPRSGKASEHVLDAKAAASMWLKERRDHKDRCKDDFFREAFVVPTVRAPLFEGKEGYPSPLPFKERVTAGGKLGSPRHVVSGTSPRAGGASVSPVRRAPPQRGAVRLSSDHVEGKKNRPGQAEGSKTAAQSKTTTAVSVESNSRETLKSKEPCATVDSTDAVILRERNQSSAPNSKVNGSRGESLEA